MNNPQEMIEKLDHLVGEFELLLECLAVGVPEVKEQWDALGRMGAQRPDHAASLLGMLVPHLTDLQRFATNCLTQIAAMKAAPFSTKAS